MVAGDCLENFAPLDASVDVSDDKDGLRLSNEVNFSQDKGMLTLQEKHDPTTVFHRCLMSKFLVVY